MAIVTISSDGTSDYVQVQDQKYSLGPVSVLTLIARLTGRRAARKALDEFLTSQQVMVNVDLDAMWRLLPYHRARFSSTNPLMWKPDQSSLENPMSNTASFETLTTNADMAEDILAKVAATNATIDRLVKEQKRFNAAAAKGDLLKVASKVADLVGNVDLAEPWVSADLLELSKTASKIHGLFPNE